MLNANESRSTLCPVVRFELIGQDADNLRQFYGELLGWQFERGPEMRSSAIRQDENAPGIPGSIRQAGPGHPNWVVFYTEVPDLPAALARARALGSRVLMPPVRLERTTVAVVSDPEGHPVGLCAAA